MKKIKRDKVCVVWLLLAIFILPFAAKTAHIYHTAEHTEQDCSDEPHTHHDCSTCSVCQFTLSSFTDTDITCYDFKVISFDSQPIISSQNKSHQQVLISYGLRAPPVA